jgi:ATP-dependent exoDNAse (exonuclease V) beta subunit
MVLFRRRADGDEAAKALAELIQIDSRLPKKKRRLKLMTYHRSKGLEADSVFLLGDCVYMASSPYKNQAYIAAKLGALRDAAPYDTSQKDELLRLAYVAITRAIRHCYWFIDAAAGNDDRPKASDHIARGQPYFVDGRKQ